MANYQNIVIMTKQGIETDIPFHYTPTSTSLYFCQVYLKLSVGYGTLKV